MVVVPIVQASFEMFESLEKSDRASNGFGSTGIS
jgi:dUTPase